MNNIQNNLRQDLLKIEEIKKLYFKDSEITPLSKLLKIYSIDKNFLRFKKNKSGEIVAYLSILPLQKFSFVKVLKGEFRDVEINLNDISSFDSKDTLNLFLFSSAIKPEYRGYGFSKKLFLEYIEFIEERHLKVDYIAADCITEDGEKSCINMGMKFINKTHHNSKVYAEKYDLIRNTLLKK